MLSGDSYRRRGFVLIILGLILTIGMGVLIINIVVAVYHSGEPGARVKFTGGPEMQVFMFGILGLVLSFGIVAMMNGIWNILYGRHNPNLRAILLALFFVFMATAGIISFFR
jgi:hypothetical protein